MTDSSLFTGSVFAGLRLKHWTFDSAPDRVLTLTLDRFQSSVNAISREVLNELNHIIERLYLDLPKALIIRSGKTAGFIAGADIQEFRDYRSADDALFAVQRGHRVFDRLAGLPIPTVAAIHGHCLGGGLELALACRFRVATQSVETKLALPEINLGIHPGWGGTARLTHLIGAPAALDMMLTGRNVFVSQAMGLGIVNRICEPAKLLETAKKIALSRVKISLKQRLTAWLTNTWLARQILATMIGKQVARKANPKHYPAPFAILNLWRQHGGSEQAMLRAEPFSVAKLAQTPTARNLVRVYFLREQLKTLGSGIDANIRNVHVIGAGVMGGDIAAWCALRGYQVSLQDRELKFIEPAMQRAKVLFEKKLRTPDRILPAIDRLRADVEGTGIADADLIIEAIYENLDAKRALYASLEPQMKSTAILASNTSSIPLTELSEKLTRPSQFIGLHYFNPVAVMPLVEIVKHKSVSDETLARTLAFAKGIDKLPVPVNDSVGFLVNRILMPYMLEAMTIYSEGVPGPVIDKAAKQFGMPMGPIELADQVGLDVAASVGKILSQHLGLKIPDGLEPLLKAGQRGKKDGQGFYKWENDRAIKPEVAANFRAPDDLIDRLIMPMLNEAAACLNEGVIETPEMLDAGVIFGTGFAPFLGGPCEYIRTRGVDSVQATLLSLAAKHGDRFKPKAGFHLI